MLKINPILFTAVLVLAGTTITFPADAGDGIFFSTNGIHHATLDGVDEVQVVSGGTIGAIAINPEQTKLYWISTSTTVGLKIYSANLDGTGIDTVRQIGWEGCGLAITNEKIYWVNVASGKILRTDLSGSNEETVITGRDYPFSIAIDFKNSKMYWSEGKTGGRICKSDMDGARIDTVIFTEIEWPGAIAIDSSLGHIFWADFINSTICRAALDGTDRKVVCSGQNGLVRPHGLDLDIFNKRVYCTDQEGNGHVNRVDYSGNNYQVLVRGYPAHRIAVLSRPAGTSVIFNPLFHQTEHLPAAPGLRMNVNYSTCYDVLGRGIIPQYHSSAPGMFIFRTSGSVQIKASTKR